MQAKEQFMPPKNPSVPEAPAPGKLPPSLEKQLNEDLAKDKLTLQKLWTGMGDVVRDIDTANTMAKDKFDGDTALMHAARGAVAVGVGAGLEKAMSYVWDEVWSGRLPFYDRNKFAPEMAKKMNDFATKSDKNARLTYFIKEGTQDLSLSLLYNWMAFRSQPILPKTGPEHLLRTLGVDALEAFALPNIPQAVRDQVKQNQLKMAEARYKDLRREFGDIDRIKETKKVVHWPEKPDRGDRGYSSHDLPEAKPKPIIDFVTTHQFQTDLDDLDTEIKRVKRERNDLRSYKPQYTEVAGKVEQVFRAVGDLSNPITQLGTEWMLTGTANLVKNFIEVRKMRGQKGGLEGKRVFMPKSEEHRYQGNRFQHTDRHNDYSKRREYDRHDKQEKVYYGRSKPDDVKAQEEYALKGS